MAILVLIRHGQSQWNLENRFTGWTDVPLTQQGKSDARKAGNALKKFTFDLAFTSVLMRAKDTLSIILDAINQSTIPMTSDQALNERDYGDLTGLNKAETVEKYGEEQVKLWRRSYDTQPPGGESIKDCVDRVLPYFKEKILPELAAGKNVIVAAHGNSMRPIIQYLDHLDNDTTATLEVGLCTPYIYTFEGEKMVNREILEVEGIVTLGASTTQKTIEEGRV